jgi:hypothetical protein
MRISVNGLLKEYASLALFGPWLPCHRSLENCVAHRMPCTFQGRVVA